MTQATVYHVSMTKPVFVLFGECSTSTNYMHVKDNEHVCHSLREPRLKSRG